MLNLPQNTLAKIRSILLRQQKEVASQLESLEKNDPVLADGFAESPESGTDSWTADVHARFVSLRNNLFNLSSRITKSLTNLRRGTYGKCEDCGREIEVKRLEAMPTATLCLICAKKPSSKSKKL